MTPTGAGEAGVKAVSPEPPKRQRRTGGATASSSARARGSQAAPAAVSAVGAKPPPPTQPRLRSGNPYAGCTERSKGTGQRPVVARERHEARRRRVARAQLGGGGKPEWARSVAEGRIAGVQPAKMRVCGDSRWPKWATRFGAT